MNLFLKDALTIVLRDIASSEKPIARVSRQNYAYNDMHWEKK